MTRSYTTASTQNSPRTWRYTAVGGETTLSGVDGFSTTLSYAVGGEQLFVNGVLLERGVDYTATNGTSVTLSNALVVGDLVTIVSQNTFAIANALPLATVQNKGDLVVGTASGAVTNLGVGADGSTLVANSSAGAGVSWGAPSLFAGKNRYINGDFGIWQRGTSFSNPANFSPNGYTADRFFTANNATGATRVISRQTFSNASSGLPTTLNNGSPQYFFRYDQQVAGTGGTYNLMEQRIEGIPFPNQTVTWSFWAKAAATLVLPQLDYEYTYNGVNYSANITSNITIGTSWQRYSVTFAMPAITGTGTASDFFGPRIWFPSSSTFTFDTWGWQLEAGSVATPFSTATGTLQGELMACQRYLPALIGSNQSIVSLATGTTSTFVTIKMPVTARVAPTGITIPALSNFNVFNGSLSTANPTAISWDSSGTDYVTISVTTTAGSPTISAGQADLFRLNTTSAYILFTGCEL